MGGSFWEDSGNLLGKLYKGADRTNRDVQGAVDSGIKYFIPFYKPLFRENDQSDLYGPMGVQRPNPADFSNPYGPQGPQGPSSAPKPRVNIDDILNPNRDSNSAYSAAAALQAMLNQIDESYARQRESLGQNRAMALGNINSAMDAYRGNIASNYADYQGQSNATQQALAQRIAEQQAAAAQRTKDLQSTIGGLGGTNGAAIQAQGQNLADSLRASGGFQQDLSSRIAQVVANSQRQYQNSGDLIRQGAAGTLENNYTAMLNALAAQMEQQKMQARASSTGSSRSNSSEGTDYTAAAKNIASRRMLDAYLNEETIGPDELAMLAGLSGKPDIQVAYLTSLMQQDQGE